MCGAVKMYITLDSYGTLMVIVVWRAYLFAVFGTIRYHFHHHEVPLMLRDMQACKWPDAFGKFHPAAMVKKSTWMLGNTLKMKKLLRKKGFDSLLSALWHFLPNLKPCQQSRLARMLYQECDPLEGCHCFWEVSALGPLCSITKPYVSMMSKPVCTLFTSLLLHGTLQFFFFFLVVSCPHQSKLGS